MLIHWIRLGLTPDAEDEDIRNRYLELVRKYSPEKHPERFKEITASYEAIKDMRTRLEARYLPMEASRQDLKTRFQELIKAYDNSRKRVGLRQLLQRCEREETP